MLFAEFSNGITMIYRPAAHPFALRASIFGFERKWGRNLGLGFGLLHFQPSFGRNSKGHYRLVSSFKAYMILRGLKVSSVPQQMITCTL